MLGILILPNVSICSQCWARLSRRDAASAYVSLWRCEVRCANGFWSDFSLLFLALARKGKTKEAKIERNGNQDREREAHKPVFLLFPSLIVVPTINSASCRLSNVYLITSCVSTFPPLHDARWCEKKVSSIPLNLAALLQNFTHFSSASK